VLGGEVDVIGVDQGAPGHELQRTVRHDPQAFGAREALLNRRHQGCVQHSGLPHRLGLAAPDQLPELADALPEVLALHLE